MNLSHIQNPLLCALLATIALPVSRPLLVQTTQQHSARDPNLGFNVEMLTPPAGNAKLDQYVAQLCKRIWPNWMSFVPQDVQLGEKGVVIVEFTIEKDGKLKEGTPTVVTSSRKSVLDRASVKAIRRSAPFDPLPKDVDVPFVELRMRSYYNTTIPKGTS